jgi:amino acid transporter
MHSDPTVKDKPNTLTPTLKSFGTLMIVMSSVSPASSVFVIMPQTISQVGSGSAMSFLLAGVLALFMAFVYAELSSAFPTAGGEYTMTGKTINRFWGFVMLILIALSAILVIAVMALGIATYLSVLGLNLNTQWTAVVMVGAATVVAILQVKVSAYVTGIFLVIEILALVLLTVFGFLHIERPLSTLVSNPQLFTGARSGLSPVSLGLIMGAVSVALFSYNGYGSAVYFGEETFDAKKNIGRIILLSLAISVVTQLVPLVAVLLGTPDLIGLIKAPQKIEYFLEARAGHLGTVIISLAVATAIFNAVIALVLQAGRIVYASGRDRTWFGALNGPLSAIHSKHNSPWVATLLVAVAGAAACFMDMNTLLLLSGNSLIAIYTILCISVVWGRRNGSTGDGHYRMPWFPLPVILCLVGLAYVFYQNLIDKDFGRPSLIITAEIMAGAGLYFFVFLARRQDWNFQSSI